MLTLLFYTPFNTRSRDTESLMQAFKKQGHRVLLLTQSPKGPYQTQCAEFGVEVHSYVIPKSSALIYFTRHCLFLIRFCRKHSVQLVYAHLENAGLPAVMSRPFHKAKIITCRHTVDEAVLMGSRKFDLLNKLVYRLSPEIIAVSTKSKEWMVQKEGVRSSKIKVIRLAYNFELYPQADPEQVKAIRKLYPSTFLLLVACRMTSGKRPELALHVLKKLKSHLPDVKLLLLGDGPLLVHLKEEVKRLKLEDDAFVLGFQNNIMDYLSACDLLLHPSVQDSSSVIIKEAGLNHKAVLACRDVGDVDEYLVNGKNAFLVSKENSETEMVSVIRQVYSEPEKLLHLGRTLHASVTERFNIRNILPEYEQIHKDLESEWKH